MSLYLHKSICLYMYLYLMDIHINLPLVFLSIVIPFFSLLGQFLYYSNFCYPGCIYLPPAANLIKENNNNNMYIHVQLGV